MGDSQKVLIIGGTGRIGSSIAKDLAFHTNTEIIVTGRSNRVDVPVGDFLALDLADLDGLEKAISNVDLVIDCAGPFHYRDARVLKICIDRGVNYIDVSDHRSFYESIAQYREEAITSGITAILNTGVFPGISNSMVRQGMDELDRAETIHLSYVVSGSGGAGITVMRTTFLGLRQPFDAWLEGQWSKVLPYSDRETIEFPKPYGKIGVYWFDVPETYTFAESFPVQSVITKFGSVPDFYNHLTWITAHIIPGVWMQNPKTIEFLSRISYFMTNITDFFTGVGVGMRVEISGWKNSQPVQYIASMFHENTAVAAGAGAGSVAQLILAGKLHRPGIWPVERVLPSELFTAAIKSRGIIIEARIF